MARGDHSKLIVRIELRPWRLRPHMTAYSTTFFDEQEFCGSGRT